MEAYGLVVSGQRLFERDVRVIHVVVGIVGNPAVELIDRCLVVAEIEVVGCVDRGIVVVGDEEKFVWSPRGRHVEVMPSMSCTEWLT